MVKFVIGTVLALAVLGVQGSEVCSNYGTASGNWFNSGATVLDSSALGFGSAGSAGASLVSDADASIYGGEVLGSGQLYPSACFAAGTCAPSASLFGGDVIRTGPQATFESIRPVVLPAVEAPIRVLPAPALPGPEVISNKCFCTKTVEKPQVFQRVIQVQTNHRFLKRSYRPVVEKIAYCTRPKC